MIQFNLLPDTKTQFIKTEKIKILIQSISIIISIICLTILGLAIFYVDIYQKATIADLNKKVTSKSTVLSSNANLNKILTVQKQAQVIPQIQSTLNQSTRIFKFVAQFTPSTATVSSVGLDLTNSKISITGNANSLATINQFVDTLKFTTYKINGVSKGNAFNNVSLGGFTYSTSTNSSYSITFGFAPDIFLQKNTAELVIPNIITTRSIVDQPSDLFKGGN